MAIASRECVPGYDPLTDTTPRERGEAFAQAWKRAQRHVDRRSYDAEIEQARLVYRPPRDFGVTQIDEWFEQRAAARRVYAAQTLKRAIERRRPVCACTRPRRPVFKKARVL
jgi:hypothetical protein